MRYFSTNLLVIVAKIPKKKYSKLNRKYPELAVIEG